MYVCMYIYIYIYGWVLASIVHRFVLGPFNNTQCIIYYIAVQCKKCGSSGMKLFQRNSHKFFDLRCTLSTSQSFQDEQTLQRRDVT